VVVPGSDLVADGLWRARIYAHAGRTSPNPNSGPDFHLHGRAYRYAPAHLDGDAYAEPDPYHDPYHDPVSNADPDTHIAASDLYAHCHADGPAANRYPDHPAPDRYACAADCYPPAQGSDRHRPAG
jgi:hypothetical protein